MRRLPVVLVVLAAGCGTFLAAAGDDEGRRPDGPAVGEDASADGASPDGETRAETAADGASGVDGDGPSCATLNAACDQPGDCCVGLACDGTRCCIAEQRPVQSHLDCCSQELGPCPDGGGPNCCTLVR